MGLPVYPLILEWPWRSSTLYYRPWWKKNRVTARPNNWSIFSITSNSSTRCWHYRFLFLVFPLISSYDTSIYLLVNNNFDIFSSLLLFSVSPFDLQRVTDRFTDKLNQQSSQLVIGDVRNHFNRVGFEKGNQVRFSIRSLTGRSGSKTARSGSIWGKRALWKWMLAMRSRSWRCRSKCLSGICCTIRCVIWSSWWRVCAFRRK